MIFPNEWIIFPVFGKTYVVGYLIKPIVFRLWNNYDSFEDGFNKNDLGFQGRFCNFQLMNVLFLVLVNFFRFLVPNTSCSSFSSIGFKIFSGST